MNNIEYSPRNWFWVVGGDESRAWSSATGTYVIDYPAGQTTRIANEIELYDVLAKAGLAHKAPQRAFSATEVRGALVTIDAAATGEAADAIALTEVAELIGLRLPNLE